MKSKRKPNLEGFASNLLLNYINARLIINRFVYTRVADLYRDYFSFIYPFLKHEIQTNNPEKIITNVDDFAKQVHVVTIMLVNNQETLLRVQYRKFPPSSMETSPCFSIFNF